MKHIRTCILLIALLFLFPYPSFAAKPRIKTATATRTVTRSTGTSYSLVRLSRPTNSVNITFQNLASVKRMEYILQYKSNGIDQGAGGGIAPNGNTIDTRTVYLGTCSHGVCTAHKYITGTTLTITTTLTSGKTQIKRYRIRI